MSVEGAKKENLSDFMGQVFEEMCRQYLFLPEIYQALPFPIGEIGRWWGNNPRARRQEEIDLMSVSDEKALFCECKWRNEKVGSHVWETLMERGELFPYPDKYYYFFSKSGFDNTMISLANNRKNVTLIDFEDMCSV